MRNDPMLDKDFLKALDEWNEREVYVKLTSLSFNESPRAEIQGYATGGSIQVNGASSVRRTCNITLVTDQVNINEFDWALETKFKVAVGLKNYIDTERYEDIIWFPQGIYVITSYSQTYNTQGYTISIQGKDKMCLLDGSVGGSLPFAHDFGEIEITHKNGTIEREKISIYDIIRNAIHTYAQEPYENIVITDLEDCSVELLDYRAKNADFFIYRILLDPITFDSSTPGSYDGTYTSQMVFPGSDHYDALYEAYEASGYVDGTYVEIEGSWYQIVKFIKYGDTAGYRLTDLTYAGDLIFSAGSAITKMLDAIVKQLGEFEYFYDINGKFIFQRKKIYFNIAWNIGTTVEHETYYDNVENASASVYTFTNSVLIDSFNNKPNFNNIRNDFAVWGKLQSVGKEPRAINLRYAIDDKPVSYKCLLNGKEYGTSMFIPDDNGDYYYDNGNYVQLLPTDKRYPYVIQYYHKVDQDCDWRELIYRMAQDQSKSSTQIESLTAQIASFEVSDEHPYSELENLKAQLTAWEATWNTGYDAYYPEFLDTDRWRKLYCSKDERPYKIVINKEGEEEREYTMDLDTFNSWVENEGWNPEYVTCRDGNIEIINPNALTFWFDFLDTDSYLAKYKVAAIGRRTKTVNDTNVKCIFNRTNPGVLFIDPLKIEPMKDTDLSYDRLNLVGGMVNYFTISTQSKSAGDEMNNLVYNHTYYNESITLSSVPVYYLEPNSRITVYDETSNINGEYIIKQYTLQLSHDGAMQITATKAEQSII